MIDLEVVCFSYNRWRLLDNCIKSIIECIPNPKITIMDDHSDELETEAFLQGLRYTRSVRVVRVQQRGDLRLGGLHRNMQLFLDRYSDAEYTLFLQDDTQIVRHLKAEDFEYIRDYFFNFPDKGFLYPMFNRGRRAKNIPLHFASTNAIWFRPSDHKYSGFSAISIFKPDRLAQNEFVFGESEEESAVKAAKCFGAMGEMSMPFVSYVPAPKTYRFKKETFTYRLWSRKNTGCFPIEIMDDYDVDRMKECFPKEYPKVERFLSSPSYLPGHPWPVFRMQNAPSYLKQVDRLELLFRRALTKPGVIVDLAWRQRIQPLLGRIKHMVFRG